MNNQEIYNSSKVIADYLTHDYLIKPEQVILDFIKKRPGLKSMLDIGVGAGRTTKYFAPLFAEYYGVDYAESMIEACEKKYLGTSYQFKVTDARNLNSFADDSIDFVLFSFNGIDCVSKQERELVLEEIFRKLISGGMFAFSSHNIYNIHVLFSLQIPKNPLRWINEVKRKRGVNKLNPSIDVLLKEDFVEIIDGDLDFEAKYVYSKPQAQQIQLTDIGFKVISVISMKGKQLDYLTCDWEKIQDPWLYFLCEK